MKYKIMPFVILEPILSFYMYKEEQSKSTKFKYLPL